MGWLIDKIMNELGIKKWIADFVQTIQDKLGITAIKDEIKEFLMHSLESVYQPFVNSKLGADGRGLMDSLNNVSFRPLSFDSDHLLDEIRAAAIPVRPRWIAIQSGVYR